MIPAGLVLVALILLVPAIQAAEKRRRRHAKDLAVEIAYWRQLYDRPDLYDWAEEGDL